MMAPQIRPLSEDLQKLAIVELSEVPSRIPEDLQALKTWIAQQPHLKARTDDQFLIQFLRGCKYSLERAKEKIDLFFTLKSKYPDMFAISDVDDSKFREIHNLGITSILPTPVNGKGPRLVVLQLCYNYIEYNSDEIFRIWTAMHEIMMISDPYACINGLVYIIDLAKTSAGLYLQFNPNFFKRIISFAEKSMPMRIKKVIYINASALSQQMFKIVLPLVSNKLRERLTILGSDLQQLTEHIPLEYLPAEYGGQNSSCLQSNKDFNNTLNEYREYFKENINFGTDESLRPGKPLDLDGLFGVGGSFRMLNVD